MKNNDLVLKTVQEFAQTLGFSSSVQFSVNYDKDTDFYQVLIQTSNPGPIIGYHGETLSALQMLVGQHLHAKTGSWLNLSINVNDYKQRRETILHSLADSAVSQVVATQKPHSLPPMPAGERRIIHLYLSGHPDVSTSSEGVGKNRYLIISPKNAG